MRINLKEWVLTVSAFTASFYLYSLFSYFGVENLIQEGLIKEYFDSNVWHLEVIIAGILFGTLFILINRLTERTAFRKRSFGFNILLKTALYILALSVVFVIIYQLFSVLGLLSNEMIKNFGGYISINLVLSFFTYCLLQVLLINFIISVSNKFGPSSLIDLLTGKYYHPRSHELIFLFLDLKDSTGIAERLGHNNYSRFIKECIHELTPVIQKHKAKVYQYVGDEVVLYWTIDEGLRQQNCLNTFFVFSELLRKQSDYFYSEYGEIPRFKAGMDSGIVTLTEIGDLKREIAFHGDVLNTASRLEKQCNEYSENLIISEHIINHFGNNSNFQFRLLSNLPLKGKSESLKFYSVNFS